MNTTTLATFGFISILTGVVYFLYHSQDAESYTTQSPSQSDTHIDTSSTRDLLDYTLTSMGEQDLTQIRERLFSAPHHEKDLAIDESPMIVVSPVDSLTASASNRESLGTVLRTKSATFEPLLTPPILGRVDLCCTFRIQQYIGNHINMNASDNMLA